eukprot:gene10906-17026_t
MIRLSEIYSTSQSTSNIIHSQDAPIASEQSGGTLTGALVGTSATFQTLEGSAISSLVNSTSSNVAASSAVIGAAYSKIGAVSDIADSASNVANAALPRSSGTLTGALIDAVSGIADSASNVANAALPRSGGTLT